MGTVTSNNILHTCKKYDEHRLYKKVQLGSLGVLRTGTGEDSVQVHVQECFDRN